MELKEIEGLLEKYWEGETSSSEEKLLKEFFEKGPVPGHLQKAAAVFAYYHEQQKIELTAADYERDVVKHLAARESSPFSWMRVAAAILLICASAFIFYKMNLKSTNEATIVENKDAYEDPEKAYAETKKALFMISAKLNAPQEYTSELSKINEASALFK